MKIFNMAKITIRIPTEQYAYVEVAYDSLAEYEAGYPEFVKTFTKVREQIRIEAKKKKENEEVPFES